MKMLLITSPVWIGIGAGICSLALGQFSPDLFPVVSKWFSIIVIFGLLILLTLVVLDHALTSTNEKMSRTFKSEVMPIHSRRHTIPEVDVDGSVIAYRWFDIGENGRLCSVGYGKEVAPQGYVGGHLTSDRVPTLNNTNGIYAAKTPDSPILNEYDFPDSVLAKVQLSGRVIEGEFGYRGQHCQILKIIRKGE